MLVSDEIVVQHEVGLHARPAAKFVKLATSFEADIKVENLSKATQAVNAKSLISLLSINVMQDDRILLKVEGENAQEALKALMDLVERNFEEQS